MRVNCRLSIRHAWPAGPATVFMCIATENQGLKTTPQFLTHRPEKEQAEPPPGERGGPGGGEGAAAPSSPGEVLDFGLKEPPPGSDLIRICPLTIQNFSLSSAAVREKNAF